MLDTYRAAFKAPGSAAFCAAGFVMRMPIAIYPIALILIVSARTGRYGFAGVLSACYVLGGAIGSPLLARWTDRYGQRRLIVPASAVHVAAILTIAVLVRTNAPQWTFVPPALLAGIAYLSVGSMVRARWSKVLESGPDLSAAYSLESTLDEVIFVIGPLIATVIATQISPVLVLYIGVVLVAAGGLWLTSLRGTEPAAHPVGEPRHEIALRARGMVLMLLATIAMGAVFASAEVAMIAFCGQHGERGAAGIALASFAGGSAVAGFVYGSRPHDAPIRVRYRRQAVIFAVLPPLFLAGFNVPVLVVAAFVAGLGTAPLLITSFGMVETMVSGRALTEGFSWVLTGLSIGYGAGSSLVGGIADAHGARVGFTVTVGAGLLAGGAGLLLWRRLTGSPAESRPVAVG